MAKEKKLPTIEELGSVERIDDLQPVRILEENAKCGFYAEKLKLSEVGSEMFRLRCESKDGEKEDFTLCPWITYQELLNMLYGCLYLHPAIVHTIKQIQANAEKPVEE